MESLPDIHMMHRKILTFSKAQTQPPKSGQHMTTFMQISSKKVLIKDSKKTVRCTLCIYSRLIGVAVVVVVFCN